MPPPGKTKFVLNMIVGNESHVILRCLNNMKQVIHAVAISFNGHDDTADKINQWMIDNNIPGEVIYRPWIKHFGFSRTEALRHAENVVYRIEKGVLGPGGAKLAEDPSHPSLHISNKIKRGQVERPLTHREYLTLRPDQVMEKYNFLANALELHKDWILNGNWYILLNDADNLLIPEGQGLNTDKRVTITQKLTKDAYAIETKQYESGSGTVYDSTFAIKLDPKKRWRWRLELHEYITPFFEGKHDMEVIKGCWMNSGREGARSKNPVKYLEDAVVFERKVMAKPNKGRSWFYLGQSYKDGGKHEESFKAYNKCANTIGWVEEIYLAFLYAADMARIAFKDKPHLYMDQLVRAREMMHDQWDAPYKIILYWAEQHQYRIGWDIGRSLVNTKPSRRRLHWDNHLVSFKFYQICGLCAWKSNDYTEAKRLLDLALAASDLPEISRQEINKNLNEINMEVARKA